MILVCRSLYSHRSYIYLSLFSLSLQSSLYSMQLPYAPMPNAPDHVAIAMPLEGGAQSSQSLNRPTGALSRSVSQGSFQGSNGERSKHARKKNCLVHSTGQTHENRAHIINDNSINVVKPVARGWKEKLFVPSQVLMLAGIATIAYLQVRLTNQAQQISADIARLDPIGDQIAGGVAELDHIIELLLNLTRRS